MSRKNKPMDGGGTDLLYIIISNKQPERAFAALPFHLSPA